MCCVKILSKYSVQNFLLIFIACIEIRHQIAVQSSFYVFTLTCFLDSLRSTGKHESYSFNDKRNTYLKRLVVIRLFRVDWLYFFQYFVSGFKISQSNTINGFCQIFCLRFQDRSEYFYERFYLIFCFRVQDGCYKLWKWMEISYGPFLFIYIIFKLHILFNSFDILSWYFSSNSSWKKRIPDIMHQGSN